MYNKIGSLMSTPNNNPRFFQICSMGSREERLATRCHSREEERDVLTLFENVLENWNQVIQLIKRVSPSLKNENYQIVIKAHKVSLGEHGGRFNAPTVNEVVVIMAGDTVNNRAIKNTRRVNTVSTFSDLHRSYDALPCPLIL